MKEYEPELGQMCFGQPWHKYEASTLLVAALREISRRLENAVWNRHQSDEGEYASPFDNSGASFSDPAVEFQVRAYSWDDSKEQGWNFKWRNVEVAWYKRLGRGTTVNLDMKSHEIEEMLESCLASLDRYEEETEKTDRG